MGLFISNGGFVSMQAALRPGLKHAKVTQNGGVRGVGIRNESGDQVVIATMSFADRPLAVGFPELFSCRSVRGILHNPAQR